MFTRLIKILAFVVGATAALPTASRAQVAISGTYYEEAKTVNCPAATFCSLFFTQTPQNVMITRASCVVGIDSAATLQTLIFGVSDTGTGNGNATRRQEFLLVPQPSPVNSNTHLQVYTSVTQTAFLFGTGKYPAITANLDISGVAAVVCKIQGSVQ